MIILIFVLYSTECVLDSRFIYNPFSAATASSQSILLKKNVERFFYFFASIYLPIHLNHSNLVWNYTKEKTYSVSCLLGVVCRMPFFSFLLFIPFFFSIHSLNIFPLFTSLSSFRITFFAFSLVILTKAPPL